MEINLHMGQLFAANVHICMEAEFLLHGVRVAYYC